VVGSDADIAKLFIGDLREEHLAAEAAGIGVHDLPGDAVLVQPRDASLDVVGAGVHLLEVGQRPHVARRLRAVWPHHVEADGIERPPVDQPFGHALPVLADSRHPFLELRRGVSFPEARRRRVVAVYVDDLDVIRGVARSHDVSGLLVGPRNKTISDARFA
jgi:hypothetical protein